MYIIHDMYRHTPILNRWNPFKASDHLKHLDSTYFRILGQNIITILIKFPT